MLFKIILAAFLIATPALADEICADRPAKATGTCTVKQGHWSITDQTSVGSITNNGTTVDQYLYVSPTIKYGVTHRLDLEAAMPLIETVTTTTGSAHSNVTGNGDLTLRAKYKIVYTGPVEFGIEPFLRAPVGHHGLTDTVWEGGALVPIGIRLNKSWLLGLDPEVDILKNKVGTDTHLATQQVVALSHAVTNKFTVSGELWGEYNFDPTRGTVRQYSADAVLCYVIAKHFEIDTGVNVGLNRLTSTQVFVGFSKRY